MQLSVLGGCLVLIKSHISQRLMVLGQLSKGRLSKGQLSKGLLSKETFVQGDYCPRKTIVQGRLLSKETFVQGDNCPRRLLSKETFVLGDYCPSTIERARTVYWRTKARGKRKYIMRFEIRYFFL